MKPATHGGSKRVTFVQITDPHITPDASIMPTVTHANTNLTTIMIAERLADLIRADS